MDDVTAAALDFDADVVVADQQALAGPLAALRTGRPWVTSASTSAEFSPAADAVAQVGQWRRDMLTGLVRRLAPSEIGPDGGEAPDLYLSPDLVLVFSSRVLTGAGITVPAQVRFVGSATGDRPTGDFDFSRLRSDRPIVYVTLGTVSWSRPAARRGRRNCSRP